MNGFRETALGTNGRHSLGLKRLRRETNEHALLDKVDGENKESTNKHASWGFL